MTPRSRASTRHRSPRGGNELGGGGLYSVVWQSGYLHAAAQAGIELAQAERFGGTSAGTVVATALSGGHLGRLHAQVSGMSKFPARMHANPQFVLHVREWPSPALHVTCVDAFTGE